MFLKLPTIPLSSASSTSPKKYDTQLHVFSVHFFLFAGKQFRVLLLLQVLNLVFNGDMYALNETVKRLFFSYNCTPCMNCFKITVADANNEGKSESFTERSESEGVYTLKAG